MRLLMVNDAVLELHSMEKEIPWETYGIHTVYTAENADQAKEVLNTQPIDILLCDIEMPGDNGIELIRWIREKNYDIECILLTCHADFAYAQEAISLGCREYIVLPTLYENIGKSVQKVVNQRLLLSQAREFEEYGKNWINQQKQELSSQNKVQSVQETVDQCAAYIQAHLGDENLNVNDIGAHFYLNPIYLSRIFKKKKGMAINQWITKQRMDLAGSLLKNPNLTANVVAQHCGYANYPYFSTVFKTHYGCTPSQYAEKYAKEE